MSRGGGWRGAVLMACLLTHAHPSIAIAQRREGATAIVAREDTLGPGLTLLSSVKGNLVIRSVGDELFVAGAPVPELASTIQSRVATKRARWAVLFYGDSAQSNGDGGWEALGAVTVAHESLRGLLWAARRDTTRRPRPAQPRLGFSEVMQITLDGDEAHLVHQPRGYSAADIIVHLESSDVLMLGNLYSSDGYPAIALDAGGRLTGLIEVISTFVTNFGQRPSIRFVPGVGAATSGKRLREYRDMLVAVRQRVLEAIRSGATEDQVSASAITKDLDAEWGHGRVSASQFLRMSYRSLVRDSASAGLVKHH